MGDISTHFPERKPHNVLSYDQQAVSDIMHLWKAVFESAYLILWQIVCEWHFTFSWNAVSLSSEQQRVGDNAHFIKCSLTTSCHDQQKASDIIHLSEWQSHQILYYDQQRVSEIAHFISMQSHHTLPYGQQFVSDTDAVLKVLLHLIYDQSLWVHCILSDNQPHYISECLEQEVSQTLLALSTYYLSIWISTANSE